MIGRFLTFTRRRWAYGIGEVVSLSVFAFCFSVLFKEHGYQWGQNDPGMARTSAICFMLLSAGFFVFSVCLKKLDYSNG